MAKDKSFAAKMAKGTKHEVGCPVCGEHKNAVLLVGTEKNELKGSWKFKEKIVQVCKCNEAEVYS